MTAHVQHLNCKLREPCIISLASRLVPARMTKPVTRAGAQGMTRGTHAAEARCQSLSKRGART
eukprot:3417670-Pleurochrysis_carterae.AAC.1